MNNLHEASSSSQILFIHGAGDGAYEEDASLAHSLQEELGAEYEILYPEMPDEANAPYDLWKQHVEDQLAAMRRPAILVGHSIGASHLAKILTETKVATPIAGIFLLGAPFWGGEGWRYDGYEKLELPKDAAEKLPKNAKIFLYHAHDDEIVPLNHLELYAKLLPQATTREVSEDGHQFAGGLSLVAKDIRSL